MSFPFGPPVAVSPLIRAARWGFLIAGILYGQAKLRVYQSFAEQDRAEKARRKVIRDREMAILKAKIAKEERETLKLLETGELFDMMASGSGSGSSSGSGSGSSSGSSSGSGGKKGGGPC